MPDSPTAAPRSVPPALRRRRVLAPRGRAARVAHAAGRALPPRVPRGAQGPRVPRPLRERRGRRRGLDAAVPALRDGRRHPVLGHPDPASPDGHRGAPRRGRAEAPEPDPQRVRRRAAEDVRPARLDEVRPRDPEGAQGRGRGPRGRDRLLRGAVDARDVRDRGRRHEVVRRSEEDDARRPEDARGAPREARGFVRRLSRGADRGRRGRRAGLRHVGGRALARRLRPLRAPRDGAAPREAPEARRGARHQLRVWLRAPRRVDRRAPGRRRVRGLEAASRPGESPCEGKGAAGQRRSRTSSSDRRKA